MEYPERIVEFAFCPRPCYQYLADLADPEDWGEDGRVLVNYIDFTYRRAAELMRRQGARLLHCGRRRGRLLRHGAVYLAV